MQLYLKAKAHVTSEPFTIPVRLISVFEDKTGKAIVTVDFVGHLTGIHVSPEELMSHNGKDFIPFDPKAVPAGFWR